MVSIGNGTARRSHSTDDRTLTTYFEEKLVAKLGHPLPLSFDFYSESTFALFMSMMKLKMKLKFWKKSNKSKAKKPRSQQKSEECTCGEHESLRKTVDGKRGFT